MMETKTIDEVVLTATGGWCVVQPFHCADMRKVIVLCDPCVPQLRREDCTDFGVGEVKSLRAPATRRRDDVTTQIDTPLALSIFKELKPRVGSG